MQRNTDTWTRGTAIAITVMVLAMTLLSVESAAAHGGHSHGDEGFDYAAVLQVGGTAAALTLAYFLASWVFRYRDTLRNDTESGDSVSLD